MSTPLSLLISIVFLFYFPIELGDLILHHICCCCSSPLFTLLIDVLHAHLKISPLSIQIFTTLCIFVSITLLSHSSQLSDYQVIPPHFTLLFILFPPPFHFPRSLMFLLFIFRSYHFSFSTSFACSLSYCCFIFQPGDHRLFPLHHPSALWLIFLVVILRFHRFSFSNALCFYYSFSSQFFDFQVTSLFSFHFGLCFTALYKIARK